MVDERRVKLDELVKRRDRVRETASRLQGRLESARAELSLVEDDCRKRGVPPEKLEATITELTRRYETLTQDLANRIDASEQTLTPYMGDR